MNKFEKIAMGIVALGAITVTLALPTPKCTNIPKYEVTSLQYSGHHHRAHRRANLGQHRVVIYYASYCDACHRTMANLDALGVHYTAIDIENGNYPGISYVPVTVIDGESHVGYLSTSELRQLLS